MTERAHPKARVRLYEAGQEYGVRYDGFGRYDLARELIGQGQVTVSQVAGEDLGLWQGAAYRASFPAAMQVAAGGIETVICRPFLDTSQGLGLGHFQPVGGHWRALRNLGLGNEVRLYQENGTPNLATGLESRFTLPTNPMFAVALWRAEPGQDHNWGQPPYTEIHFGIGAQEEWAIVIPYGAPVFVLRREGATWQRVPAEEKSVHMPTLEGTAKGQRSFLWVGVLQGKLVLSTDGFVQDVAAVELPDGPVRVAQSRVTMWHNAGQWAVSLFPIKMAEATIWSPGIETGYLTQESDGEVFTYGYGSPVVNDAGDVLSPLRVSDDTAEREGLGATERSWQVQLWPYQHREQGVGVDPETQASVDFATWVSPEWVATQIGQQAEVEAGVAPGYVEVSADVTEVQGEDGGHRGGTQYRVSLDNQRGTYSGLGEYRRMTVALGWQQADGSEGLTQVGDGYVVESPLVAVADQPGEAGVNVLDAMLRLRDEKADGRTPVFDGWPVVEALQWILRRCGIPDVKQDLEDTGTLLTAGAVEKPAWQIEPGRSWAEVIHEMARFDYNAAVYFDGDRVLRKACRHCRRKRSAADVTTHTGELESGCPAEVDWELYTRASVATEPAAPGEILGLRRTRQSLGADEFANYVVVCGVGADGRPVRAVTYDAASLYDPQAERYVGWRKMDVWTLPGLVGEAAVNRLAVERLGQLGKTPEQVVVATPLLAEARVGQVLRIAGGETTGASGHLYRITGLKHRVTRRPEQVAVTVLEARWLGSEE